MRRLILAALCVLLIGSLAACGKKGPPKPPEEAKNYYGSSR